MTRIRFFVAVLAVLAAGATTAQAQINYYYDLNDDAAGSGVPDGNLAPWDTTTVEWNNINADGTQASPGLNVAWTNGNNAIFSAGTDAAGLLYGFNISAGITANAIEIQEGTIQLQSGNINVGTGTLTIQPGAALRTIASLQFTTGLKIALNGTSTTDAAEIQGRNTASAGSMLTAGSGLSTVEINGFGRVSYDDGDGIPDNKVSIIASSVITGVGGTPDNGGAGTLIKSGPDQIGYMVKDTGGGVMNYTLNSFAKLLVQQGGFRLRGLSGNIDDRMFGAVPLSVLADAITLDGGGIGSNATVTLHANRGITITANGGYFDSGATAGLNIPGPLTVAAGTTLTIGDPTTTAVNAPNFQLSNANNTTTFQGNLLMKQGTLQLNTNLNAAGFSGVGQNGAVGIVNLNGAAVTLTAGSDNASTSWDGRATGTGIFTKVGSGVLTMNPPTTEWTNTGGVNINGGEIKYGTAAAGFSSAAPVSIASGSKLNMAGVNDSFGSLAGPAGSNVDMNDGGAAATPGNLTLAAASGSTTFSGTITGGGNLSKTAGSTQILAGNNTVGVVTVSGGNLRLNGTNTTGAVNVTGGTLSGTGSVSGDVTVSGTGHIAPGASIESLDVGSLTLNAGSILDMELGAPTAADLINVTTSSGLTLTAGTVNLLDSGGLAVGTYKLIDYSGTLNGVVSNLTLGTTPSGFSYALVNNVGGTSIDLNVTPGGLPGDFNSDSKVDAADYVTWRTNGEPNTAGTGPLPNDGGATDQNGRLTLWRANFGNPGSGGGLGGGSAVPEPTAMVLVLLGLGALGVSRRGR